MRYLLSFYCHPTVPYLYDQTGKVSTIKTISAYRPNNHFDTSKQYQSKMVRTHLLIRVRQTVDLGPEEQAEDVRLQIRPPHLLAHTASHALYELLRRSATGHIQACFLLPLVGGFGVEQALSTHPLEDLRVACRGRVG